MNGTGAIVFDEPQRSGIPQENLTALKAFLATRRPSMPEQSSKQPSSGDLSGLPPDIRIRVKAFLSRARQAKLLMPDGSPKPEWKVFYGADWFEAQRAAADAVHKKGRNMGCGDNCDMKAQLWIDADNNVNAVASQSSPSGLDMLKEVRLVAFDTMRKPISDAIKREQDIEPNMQSNGCPGWGAETDAGLVARLIAVDHLPLRDKEEHMANIMVRWEVWTKGYALFTELDGVLYVYCKGEKPKGSLFKGVRRGLRFVESNLGGLMSPEG